MIREFAPAKVNLTLHVTGRRADGYHLLDSLVVFADIGDWLMASPAERLTLALAGPQAGALTAGPDNLVLRAARSFEASRGAALVLEKHLPVSSGVGGGSTDAAAALRLLARLWRRPLPEPGAVLRLGADVPVCLKPGAARMAGVGEIITPLPSLPEAWMVLANPGTAVSTPAIFAALARRENPVMPRALPPLPTLEALATFMGAMRNDLEPSALAAIPMIAEVKAALAAQPGCRIARMSGSGATCFGLFPDTATATAAARAIARPDWWVRAGRMLS
ncbi:MAG: 4-(cytidine 5'-diphospho)-2-C-methyl-D-erythritol kinase [Gemmobacter sp.]|jgi:4-diphosphocytidyl-2-C-methyl-D-erythritol kinase|nr:4-(cytidine 5'-diphospho)-2-C-methyl-D-erythritol kinase [Gemmobacter sp.]